jgi:hypothetical protein
VIAVPAIASSHPAPPRTTPLGRVVRRGTATIAPLAPVAQLDRASVYGTEGRGFEFLRAHCETPACRGFSCEARRGTLPGMVRSNATFADAAAEFLR